MYARWCSKLSYGRWHRTSGAGACLRCQLCQQVLEVLVYPFAILFFSSSIPGALNAHLKLVNMKGDKPDIIGARPVFPPEDPANPAIDILEQPWTMVSFDSWRSASLSSPGRAPLWDQSIDRIEVGTHFYLIHVLCRQARVCPGPFRLHSSALTIRSYEVIDTCIGLCGPVCWSSYASRTGISQPPSPAKS